MFCSIVECFIVAQSRGDLVREEIDFSARCFGWGIWPSAVGDGPQGASAEDGVVEDPSVAELYVARGNFTEAASPSRRLSGVDVCALIARCAA